MAISLDLSSSILPATKEILLPRLLQRLHLHTSIFQWLEVSGSWLTGCKGLLSEVYTNVHLC